jgi:hypothetical protein
MASSRTDILFPQRAPDGVYVRGCVKPALRVRHFR